ncbi:uncharacterized protein LOC116256328 isoform X2 [Nymphaea colorata]|uniref:uncharacterized protein LOC116256328 isoform X2 n=1 Tax=Nymphaea colorata TaxID=210225 RepID=UPI00129E4F30|nr:uncharacterized protein LOC116256328 isoform X2 [Nymphaea colorata]
MKLVDLLKQSSKMEQRRMELQQEVGELQKILKEQQKLKKVQLLLSEITIVEEEISYLEKKISELKLRLYEEKIQTQEIKSRGWHRHHENFCMFQTQSAPGDLETSSPQRERKTSWSSCSETNPLFCDQNCTVKDEEEPEKSSQKDTEPVSEKPNQLSEELVKCLISIFRTLNKTPSQLDSVSSATISKLTLSCMSSRSFVSKSSFNGKPPIPLWLDSYPLSDPYGVAANYDCLPGDIGPYKNYVQLTRNSLNFSQMPQCIPSLDKLRDLMDKLRTVDLRLLTYKKKLAFWINTYNACIMHAFLHYGLPSTTDKLLALMNKAALNVGGIVLNALAIEHFILRHPSDYKNGLMDEKEVLLRRAYGLGYPEPNVTFALCRGSCSSPAIRVYTAENVMNELENAKTEFLQASIGVTIKKRIVLPKLLYWYMRDFADDLESLLEWIYSQLPRTTSLRKSIMDCLKGERKWPIQKMVELQPYVSDFRYILALS